MKRALLLLLFLGLAASAKAQTWTGILHPTSGTGLCPFVPTASPGACGIDWSTAGVPGGIPSGSWTQSGSTITATSGDRTATIQTALNACGTNHFVLLGAGTFNITHLNIPSNCVLRGSGTLTASGTIINLTGTSGSAYSLGTGGPNFTPLSANITSGAVAGSTSIVVNSASGISTGTLLAISEKNDPAYVTINSANGACTWCDGTGDSGVRARGQVVLVTAVSGTTITISPALYTNYGTATGTGPAQAYYFSATIHAGAENLQTFSNGTGYSQVYSMIACRECWVKGVMDNYADGDHVDVYWGFHDEIRDSYFSNAYIHLPGNTDADVDLALKTSGTLVENNILERLHAGIMMEWGAAGNVVGYNYEIGNFGSDSTNVILAFINFHGAHPQFNLFEGNIGNNVTMDAFWGSGSNNTLFRNNFRGTDTLASPEAAGRNVVNWASTTLAFQQMMGEQFAFPHTNINNIGNVLGSANAATAATTKYNSGTAPFTSTIIPSATRTYDHFFSATSVGYNTGSDTSGASVASFSSGPGPTTGYWVGKASSTIFQHGNFDIASNSVIWKSGVTQTLPASFYRGAKPAWFGSIPWPPIGPDVTGGAVDNVLLAGHVYANPAEACYETTARDANGLKLFDPNACYVNIAPPTFLYGTGVQATALNNINVGGPSNWRVAYRFKANYTDTITSGVYYRITSATPGYSGGTLGTIVATIASDAGGVPGTTIATCTGANTGFFPAFTCSAAVTSGLNYYVVFTNTDPSPTINFASVDGLYNVGGVPDPNFRYTTLINNGSGWSTYPTTQPIIQINYANGHAQGNGYMEVWINNDSTTLTSTTWARELFTPTSPHTVYSVTIGPAAVAGTTVTLSTAAGVLIETGTLPARDPTGWATYVFSTPRVLATGTQYQLILKAAGVVYPIRKGVEYGFTTETYFPDGHAQFSTDSGGTWTDFNDENTNPSTEGDLEFTFLTVPIPNITTLTLPGATQTGAYTTTLAVSGGTAPYTWAINAGTLPAGLSLNASTGVISGTTSGTGTSTFTIRVTDAAAQTDTQALNIFVALAPAVTTTSPLPAATKNLAYSATLALTDGTLNCSWAVTVGTLPTGLSLNSATGAITGTPTIAGTSSFTVRVTDANSVAATKALSITVNAPAIISTTSPLPQGTQGTAYTTTISASGGTPAYAWSVSAGTLPIGLSINSTSGVISGTPSVSGTFNFTVTVTDAVNLFSSTPFSMVVNAPPQVTVVTSSLPNGALFTAYGVTVTASAGTTPYTWSISVGSLPAGLSLNTTTGFISGTPTASGVTNFTVRVVDVNSTFDTKALSITVPVPNTTVGAPKGTMP